MGYSSSAPHGYDAPSKQPEHLGGASAGGSKSQKDKKKKEEQKTLIDEPTLPAGATPPGKLPPGLNPAKYSPNPTPSYEATPHNLGVLGLEAIGALIGGPGALAKVAGSEEVTGASDALGLGFEKPTGEVGGADYDGSNLAGKDNAVNGMATSQTTGPRPEKDKKKKNPKPGFTLLEGAGGTLLGT